MAFQHPMTTAGLAIFADGALCYLFWSKVAPEWQKARLHCFAVHFLAFVILLFCHEAVEDEFAASLAILLMGLAFSTILGIHVLFVLLPLTLPALRASDRVGRISIYLAIGVTSILVGILLGLGGLHWWLSGADWLWGAISPVYFASSFLSVYLARTTMSGSEAKTHKYNGISNGIAGLVSAVLAVSCAFWPPLSSHHLHLDLQGIVAFLDVLLCCSIDSSSWPVWLSWLSWRSRRPPSRRSSIASSSYFGDWFNGRRQVEVEQHIGARESPVSSQGCAPDIPMGNMSTQNLVRVLDAPYLSTNYAHGEGNNLWM